MYTAVANSDGMEAAVTREVVSTVVLDTHLSLILSPKKVAWNRLAMDLKEALVMERENRGKEVGPGGNENEDEGRQRKKVEVAVVVRASR